MGEVDQIKEPFNKLDFKKFEYYGQLLFLLKPQSKQNPILADKSDEPKVKNTNKKLMN